MTRKSNPSIPDTAEHTEIDKKYDKVESGFFEMDSEKKDEVESAVSFVKEKINSGLFVVGDNDLLLFEDIDRKEILADKRIFVADDDVSVLRSVARGFLVYDTKMPVLARNGLEAIEKVKSGEEFDAYLIDYEMPGVNGVQVAMEVRKTDPTGIIVIHSGFDFGNDEEKYGALLDLMRVGVVNRFIQKGKGDYIGAICEELVTRK